MASPMARRSASFGGRPFGFQDSAVQRARAFPRRRTSAAATAAASSDGAPKFGLVVDATAQPPLLSVAAAVPLWQVPLATSQTKPPAQSSLDPHLVTHSPARQASG
jgi:hypothetical protein